jgi:protein SCO1/2
MRLPKTTLILILFFALLCSIFLGYYYFQILKHPKPLKTYGNAGHTVGSFSFLNQDGKETTQEVLQNKIAVVEFFFTTCEGICPTMNDNMVTVYNAYRNDPEIVILSHTVDPETDTVEQMKRYSLKYDADPSKWLFLTGTKEALYKMALDDYLISVADSTVEPDHPVFIHSPYFVLVDKTKAVRGFYDGTKPEKVKQLVKDIVALKKE